MMDDLLSNPREEDMSRKEREFFRHRSEILSAAESIFAEKGYVASTMEEIAHQAEFAVGTLYKFFRNKADLYAAVILDKIDGMSGIIDREIAKGRSPLEKIEICFRVRIDLFWSHPFFFRLLYNDLRAVVPNSRAAFVPEILSRYGQFLQKLETVFSEGIRLGVFREVNPSTLIMVFEAIIGGYLERMTKLDEPRRVAKEEDHLLLLFLSGALQNFGEVPGDPDSGASIH